MVASANGDLYSFHSTMNHDDGPQSSEEGSGMHSPVLYGAAPGDSFRYQHDQLDVQHATSILPASQYQYSLAPQHSQIVLDNARHVSYSSPHYLPSPPAHPPRHHMGVDLNGSTRIPSPGHGGGGGSVDWYGHIPERRLPGGPSQDHPYPRPGGTGSMALSMPPDNRTQVPAAKERPEHSAATPPGSSTTERRKETSNVVIACRQCRSRKIRCDSTRPGCNNCARRNNQCEYDAVPKRRGPDKRPGTRQRTCKKRPPPDGTNPAPPKRKKTSSDRAQEPRESAQTRAKDNNNMAAAESTRSPTGLSRASSDRVQPSYPYGHHPNASPTTDLRIATDHPPLIVKTDHSPVYQRELGYEQGFYTKSFPRPVDMNAFPSLEAMPRNISLQSMNPGIEEQLNANWALLLKHHSIQMILHEIGFVARGTSHYLAFINVTTLEKQLWNEPYQLLIHPGFIWAAMAMAKLMRSSSAEDGPAGLQTALLMFKEAKSALEIAWADPTYAYAALIVALFESSAHPNYSHGRALSALIELDDYIHQMSLTMTDSRDIDVCMYQHGVPVVYYPNDRETLDSLKGCPCLVTSSIDPYNARSYIPPWNPSWTPQQSKAEEVRRLCWSALSLISGFLAQCATDNRSMPKFHLSDPALFQLLFPGEVMDRLHPAYSSRDGLTTKESIWALYCRSMLLWNYCNRFRYIGTSDDDGVSEEISEAWSEAQTIEESLDMHKCNLDSSLIYTTREHIHNVRMIVTQAMRKLQGYDRGMKLTPGPVFKRKQAEDWIYYQDQLVRKVISTINNIGSAEGIQLTQRPFRVQWFIHQLSTCLQLWEHEHNLDEALALGRRLLKVVDTMNTLWECPTNQAQASELRRRLTDACHASGVEPPYTRAVSIPSNMRP